MIFLFACLGMIFVAWIYEAWAREIEHIGLARLDIIVGGNGQLIRMEVQE